MAKKIAEVPLPKENFLHGYKPITPNFSDEDEVYAVIQEEKPKDDAKTKPSPIGKEKEYISKFLKPAANTKKDNKVGLTLKHYELLSAIVGQLSTPTNKISRSDYLWNVLQEHFKTYGDVIWELIRKIPPKNPFDDFE